VDQRDVCTGYKFKPNIMSSCKTCGKTFTCGCQKAKSQDGSVICKNCRMLEEEKFNNSNKLNLELARQQIVDLTNK